MVRWAYIKEVERLARHYKVTHLYFEKFPIKPRRLSPPLSQESDAYHVDGEIHLNTRGNKR